MTPFELELAFVMKAENKTKNVTAPNTQFMSLVIRAGLSYRLV